MGVYVGAIALAIAIGIASSSGGAFVSCFKTPGACGYPDPAYNNVGIPPGTVTTVTDCSNLATANQTLNQVACGCTNIFANNVTIENSTISCVTSAAGPWVVFINGGVSGSTFLNDTLTNTGIAGVNGIWSAGATGNVITKVLTSNIETLYHDDSGSATITSSYSVAQDAASGDHVENVFCNNDTLDLEHSVLYNPYPQTSVVNCGAGNSGTAPCINVLTVNNNLLSGGGYSIYPCQNAANAGTSVIKVTNNRWTRCTKTPTTTNLYGSGGMTCNNITVGGCTSSCGNTDPQAPDNFGYYPLGGYFGIDSGIFCASTTWTSNVFDDNSATVGC